MRRRRSDREYKGLAGYSGDVGESFMYGHEMYRDVGHWVHWEFNKCYCLECNREDTLQSFPINDRICINYY